MTRKIGLTLLSMALILALFMGCSSRGNAGGDVGIENPSADGQVIWGSSSGGGKDSLEAPGESGSGSLSNGDSLGDSLSKGDSSASFEDSSGAAASSEERKLIRTVDLDARTQAFDEFMTKVRDGVIACGGYIERSSENAPIKASRFASITLRIPAGETDGILDLIGTLGTVTRKTEQMSDVTLKYVDTQSRLKALRAEETSLLSLLEEAKSVSDIISLQDRLSTVRYQIESCESTLRTYDNQVDYATVSLYVTETKDAVLEDPTVWEEIGENLAESMENLGLFFRDLFVGLVSASPYLLVFLLIPGSVLFLVVFLVLRRRKRKKVRRGEPKPETDGNLLS